MIYMVECGFADAAREEQWNTWYSGPKLDALLQVPDFLTAQRFKANDELPSPYLNVTSIRSADMFNSPDYRGRGGGGFGPWPIELIIDWDRRLFTGIEQMPAVADDARLLLLDRSAPKCDELDLPITWLEGQDWQKLARYSDGVALDQSVSYRGFCTVSIPTAARLPRVENMRLYTPISAYRHK